MEAMSRSCQTIADCAYNVAAKSCIALTIYMVYDI